ELSSQDASSAATSEPLNNPIIVAHATEGIPEIVRLVTPTPACAVGTDALWHHGVVETQSRGLGQSPRHTTDRPDIGGQAELADHHQPRRQRYVPGVRTHIQHTAQ